MGNCIHTWPKWTLIASLIFIIFKPTWTTFSCDLNLYTNLCSLLCNITATLISCLIPAVWPSKQKCSIILMDFKAAISVLFNTQIFSLSSCALLLRIWITDPFSIPSAVLKTLGDWSVSWWKQLLTCTTEQLSQSLYWLEMWAVI